jgi:sialate O-acetylesterase
MKMAAGDVRQAVVTELIEDPSMNTIRRVALVAALVCLLSALPRPAAAEVKVSPLFVDHMVLQQGMAVPVFGTAGANEQVTVIVGDAKATATADASGRWLAKLGPLQAGGPVELTVAGTGNTLTVKDVLVGEVWVCSGQSNMEWVVANSNNFQEERNSANYPAIRMFTVKKAVTGAPAKSLEGSWAVCNPQNVAAFSAVGYFFGRELHKSLNVPVGLIHTSWGGTPAESWAQRSALEADPDFKPILDRWDGQFAQFQRQLQQLPATLDKWMSESQRVDAEGRPVPQVPLPQDPRSNPWRPAGLYNAMVAPLLPYGIKGAIWYQGESNAGRAYQYRKLLPAMIQSWRKAWGQGDFPFYIVSLANFTPVKDEPGDSDWAELREAQTITANTVPQAGQSITIDIGEANDIHPRNKQEVGRRLALVALAKTYGKDIPYSGPTYDTMKVQGDSIRLMFKNTTGGLVARGGETLKGFAVAGEDRKWHWANALIDGDSVVVRSDQVQKPVAVRYAWANNPVCNLYNGAGLPAVPFRTDDWKGITADSR